MDERTGPPAWLAWLLGLLLLALLALLLVLVLGDDEGEADEAFDVGPEVGNAILVRLEPFAGQDAADSPFQVERGGRVTFTGGLREIDEPFLSVLQPPDGADDFELGDLSVQADQISSVG